MKNSDDNYTDSITKSTVRVLIILIAIGFIVYISVYFIGFMNYGRQAGWDPIKSYELNSNKFETEKSLRGLIDGSGHNIIQDTVGNFCKDNWYCIYVLNGTDSNYFSFRFTGDSVLWQGEQNKAYLDLMFLGRNRSKALTATDRTKNEGLIEELTEVFERRIIRHLNK